MRYFIGYIDTKTMIYQTNEYMTTGTCYFRDGRIESDLSHMIWSARDRSIIATRFREIPKDKLDDELFLEMI